MKPTRREAQLETIFPAGTPLLADGGMGTLLNARGFAADSCFDALNLTSIEEVINVHAAYIDAGAGLIETNTFGANRYKLAAHGLDQEVTAINRAGAEAAQQACASADRKIWIAGSVGPLGVRLVPYGRVQHSQAAAAFTEQIGALVEGGVDLLLIETQTDLEEARLAIEAARQLCDLPLVVSMTFTRDDHTLLGDTPQAVGRALQQAGADVIGVNCAGGPAQILRLLEGLRQGAPGVRCSAMPNAGFPESIQGRMLYPASAAYFADFAAALLGENVALIGGCCGTTRAHIAAMSAALKSGRRRPQLAGFSSPLSMPAAEPPQPADRSQLARKLDQGRFVIAVEVSPPRGLSPHRLIASAQLLAEAGADVIDVTDSPMASMRMSPWAVTDLIHEQVGLETVLHFPTRGRNLLRVQGDLLAAHALGVRNLFVLMGDPTSIGDYPDALDDYDVVPSGLIQLIKQRLNAGIDQSGRDLGGGTSFFVGCALNLGARDLGREARVLERKIKAGADFALTQPIYAPTALTTFLEIYEKAYGKLELPLLLGLLPLSSVRHAAYLANEVPGISIPPEISQQIEAAGDQAVEAGLRQALDLIQAVGHRVRGAYVIPPFNRFDVAAGLIEELRRLPPFAPEDQRLPGAISAS